MLHGDKSRKLYIAMTELQYRAIMYALERAEAIIEYDKDISHKELQKSIMMAKCALNESIASKGRRNMDLNN